MINQFPSNGGPPQSPRAARFPTNAQFRYLAYQLLLVAGVGFAVWYMFSNAARNLEERNIASGFQFLFREAGFAISESTFFTYNAAHSYLRALGVGVFNTLKVAVSGIFLATIFGTLIGIARLSRNWLLATLAAVYVESIRNSPLIVQLFFWYAVVTEGFPGPADALRPLPGIFVSNRGIVFPIPQLPPIYPWLGAAFAAGLACAWVLTRRIGRGRAMAVGTGCAVGVTAALFIVAGVPMEMSVPVLRGFNFSGGGALSPEFAALLCGLVMYTSAFVAEIVRGGIQAVNRGQFEAAHSLGLSRGRAMRLVILPQALRAIVPPLTSQYLNLIKNSSLAVAIGYPELVSIANTTINQTGQAIEGIAIIMMVYLTISLAIAAFMNRYNRRVALKGGKP